MDSFRSYVEEVLPLDSQSWQLLVSCATQLTLKKDEILVYKGAKFPKEVFVETGTVRSFLVDEEGNEKSTAFFTKSEFMSTTTYRNKQGRSVHNYQALTSTSLLVFEAAQLREVFDKHPQLLALGKGFKEKERERWLAKEECLIQAKALDRYTRFLTCFPALEDEISHIHIASYLGITPVSLSRIRKKMRASTSLNN